MDYAQIFQQAFEAGNTEVAVAALNAASSYASTVAMAKAMIILAMIPTAIAEAWLVRGAFAAIGRNPELKDALLGRIITLIALVESTAIYAFVAYLILS